MYYLQLHKNPCILLILIIFISFLSGCNFIPEEEEALAPPLVKPKREEYELYEVQKKDITNYVKGSGNLVASEEKALFFKQSGSRLKDIDAKVGREVKKGDVLGRLDTGDLDTRIKLQEYALKKAELNLARLKEESGDRYSIESAKLDVLSNKLLLDDLKKEMDNSLLIAPMDGVVTFVDNLSEGDMVEAYKRIITISDPKKLRVYYQSNDVNKVKAGMEAEIRIKGQAYTGEVVLSPDNIPKDAHESLKNAIIIDVKDLPQDAKMGDLAEISIPIETRQGVLVIPKRALKQYMGGNTVQIIEGESKKELDVEIGIQTPTEVEIISGLEEGQKVILR